MSVSGLFSGMFSAKATQQSPILRSDSFGEEAPVLNMGASARAVLDKANDVAQPVISAFDRSKATAEYSVKRTIYYTFVGIVRSISTRLYKDKAQNLAHYQKHKAFQDGIEKVSKAFTQYRDAEKAVQEAPAGKLLELRQVELEKANALVAKYDELIALAAGQADYQADIHEGLAKADAERKDDAMIFQTVNAALAKIRVGNGVRNLGKGESKELQESCKQFLSNFVEHVQQALVKTGAEASGDVIEAFSAGLGSFPEMATDVDAIQMHADLIKLRDPSKIQDAAERQQVEAKRAKMVKVVTQKFALELIMLMIGDKEITRSDLEKIHCQGIPLLAVKKFSDDEIEQLENLRKCAKDKQKVLSQREILETSKRGVQADLAEKTAYRTSDIANFLEDIEVGQLARDPNLTIDSAQRDGKLGQGFTRFQTIRAQLADVNGQFTRAKAAADAQKAGFDQRIALYESMIDDASSEINTLIADASGYDRTVKGLREGLEKIEAKYQLALEEMGTFFGERPNADEVFKPSLLANAKTDHDDKVKQITDQIASLSVKQVQAARTAQTLMIQRDADKTDLEALKVAAAASEAQNKTALKALDAQRDAIAGTTVDISRDEIRQFADYLGLRPSSPTRSSMFETLGDAQSMFKAKESLDRRIAANGQEIARLDAELAKRPLWLLMTGNDRFTVDQDAAFGAERGAIVAMLDENLDIAKEITARVAVSSIPVVKARAERDEALAKEKGLSAFDSSMRQRFVGEYEKKAQALPQMDQDGLIAAIQRRVDMLPKPSQPVVDDEDISMDGSITSEDRTLRMARIPKLDAPYTYYRGVGVEAPLLQPAGEPAQVPVQKIILDEF